MTSSCSSIFSGSVRCRPTPLLSQWPKRSYTLNASTKRPTVYISSVVETLMPSGGVVLQEKNKHNPLGSPVSLIVENNDTVIVPHLLSSHCVNRCSPTESTFSPSLTPLNKNYNRSRANSVYDVSKLLKC